MRSKFYAAVALMFGSLFTQAQDLHFSQYYAMPLTLNPALTGKFEGLYRINAIYRGQYFGVTQSASVFRTPGISADFSLLKDKMKGNALGIGLAVVNDVQSSNNGTGANGENLYGNISNTNIALNIGYTLNLNKKRTTQIAIGLQPSLSYKSNSGVYEFPDAFRSDLSYNQNSPNHENTPGSKKLYFNFGFGAFFNTNPIKWLTFYVGYSMANVAQPNVGVIGSDKLPFRHVVHSGFEFDLGSKFTLSPGFLYQYMAKANEANVGLTLAYNIINKEVDGRREKASIWLGLWNRIGNDVNSPISYRNITPKIGFEYKRFRLGFAYDVDMGQFSKDAKTASTTRPQGYELSLSYMGFGTKPPKENLWMFSPRF